MTKFVTFAFVVCACALLASAQYNNFGFGYNSYFGSPGYGGLSAAASRDPRHNTGPVLFPPSPAGEPEQTSGVVVGASGFGFQAPGAQGPVVPRYFYRRFYGRR